jgi:hypothetical protein
VSTLGACFGPIVADWTAPFLSLPTP